MTDTATGRRGQKHAFSLPRRWLVGGLATLAAVAFIGLPAEAARAWAGGRSRRYYGRLIHPMHGRALDPPAGAGGFRGPCASAGGQGL